MNTLYLHIGPHKTGSTYLQKALFQNKEALEEQRVFYPLKSSKEHFAHHRLAELYYLKKFDDANLIVNDIIMHSDGDIVLSSENFDRLDYESIMALKSDFKSYKVKVVFFSRNVSDLLVSNWQEDVKHGYTLSWGEYAYIHLLKPFQSNVINKNKILDVYADVFGYECITVLDYSYIEQCEGDIFEEFLSLIGADLIDRKDKKTRINKSMSYSKIEIIRALNAIYHSENRKVNHYVRTAFLGYMKANPSCPHVAAIEDSIKSGFQTIDMNSSFSLKYLDKIFLEKYKVANASFESRLSNKNNKYDLPTSDWVFNPALSDSLDYLVKNLEVYYGEAVK